PDCGRAVARVPPARFRTPRIRDTDKQPVGGIRRGKESNPTAVAAPIGQPSPELAWGIRLGRSGAGHERDGRGQHLLDERDRRRTEVAVRDNERRAVLDQTTDAFAMDVHDLPAGRMLTPG